ncbi:MAG: type 4a pilus biogenesis protein PilO [Acidobacteriota bacterium]
MAGFWVLAVAFCLAALGILIWQTSGPMGRRGLIENQIEQLNQEIDRLDLMTQQARAERDQVAMTGETLERIDGELFGKLDDRMTAVLREVGAASRDAGLLPDGFSYQEVVNDRTGGVRFGIGFSVEGTYEQIRSLLESLQASPQFLIIDSISFKGEEDARSQILSIRLQVSTYLAEAEVGKLRALVERTRLAEPVEAPEAEDAS